MTIRGLALTLPIVFLGWLGTLVSVGLLSDAAPAMVVLWPGEAFLSRLDGDVSVLGANGLAITLASEAPNLARRLYASGAWLVLPAGLPGCLPLPRLQPAA